MKPVSPACGQQRTRPVGRGYAAISYAENDNKTDRKMYVGGINCSKQNAYAEMVAVQRRFGLRGKVVGYHGIQSFREDEVTPEQAFEIGKATARRMWGDKYQVLVTVHAVFSKIRNRTVRSESENSRLPKALGRGRGNAAWKGKVHCRCSEVYADG